MFKLLVRLVTLGSLLSALTLFQNCSQGLTNSEDLSSLGIDDEMTQIHKDRNHGIETKEKPKVEATADDLLTDRRLTTAILENVFGAANFQALANTSIRNNRAEFGNNCSLHENYRVLNSNGSLQVANTASVCATQDTTAFLNAPVFPKASVLRSQILINVCRGLANTPGALSQGLAKIGPGLPQASAENVLKAFRLFYRNKPDPHEALIQSLQIMTPGTVTKASDWAPVFYTLCISPGWQVL